MQGKKILLGVTGSIAAYKAPFLVRELIKEGAEVRVIMTPAASDFVSKLTLSTLTNNPVTIDMFDESSWSNHVMLGRWADVMLIAPLSCNTLAKMAAGMCDNFVLATYLSSICPVVAAPAMDEDMWSHPTTKSNLKKIKSHGVEVLDVEYGELASGLIGNGRMTEPTRIISFLQQFFVKSEQLKGKKVLVTAGPTYEAIDPVRFIGNHSSGKMGYAIAEDFKERGAEVTLVTGPVSLESHTSIKKVEVISAREMYDACINEDYDIAVMAAAVADYTPESTSDVKIKKSDVDMNLRLKKTVDILENLGKKKNNNQILVGFALETDNEEKHALKKLHEKNADLIILNSLKDEGAGFKKDTNKVTLFFKDGTKKNIELKSKSAVAKDIVDSIIEIIK